jgi:hypothetical protein
MQAHKIIHLFSQKDQEVKEMISRSFLSTAAKQTYLKLFKQRQARLAIKS